jgi:glutamyl-tRNA reductase
MGEAAARSLAQTGTQLVVVNRSLERAQSLAERCGGEARPYETMAMELVQADVVITSTASPAFVLTYELLRDVVRARRHRPLFLIDIAVPRDIDPRAAKLGGVFLYDVDDLQKVADENLSARRQHLASAEQIVETEVRDFEAWKRTLELTPTIVALRRRFADVVRSELERALPRVGALSTSERQALDKMVHATVNKLLHDPLTALKSGAAEPDGALLIATARRLFRIDEREAAELEATANANDLAPEAPALELATALGQNGERK